MKKDILNFNSISLSFKSRRYKYISLQKIHFNHITSCFSNGFFFVMKSNTYLKGVISNNVMGSNVHYLYRRNLDK